MTTYKIADKMIAIEPMYASVSELWKGYEHPGEPELVIKTVKDDITYEQERSDSNNIAEGKLPHEYEAPYLEELSVYRKLCDWLPFYNTVLFHCSCVVVGGQAYAFTAKSGTGKSTHTRLWREYLGERAVMLNDDKPLIRCKDAAATIFGTPYMGKHSLGCNMSAPLRAICILERGEQNEIEKLTREQAYPMLVQQTYRPFDVHALSMTMQTIDSFSRGVSLYRLKANMDISAAKLAFETMSR